MAVQLSEICVLTRTHCKPYILLPAAQPLCRKDLVHHAQSASALYEEGACPLGGGTVLVEVPAEGSVVTGSNPTGDQAEPDRKSVV